MNLTDRQLERLRILACPKSYVSSLFDPDRAAVRAAVGEIERLRTELGEWWRAAVALNDAADDDAERAARSRIDSLRTGSSWSHVPESVAELMVDQLEVATAGRNATTATINQLRADVLRLEDEARSLAAERDALLAQDADARSAPRLRAEVERLRAEVALSRDIIGHLNDDVASLAYNDVEKLTAEIEQSRAEVARLRAALANVREMAEADIGFGRADDGTPWIFRIRDDARSALEPMSR